MPLEPEIAAFVRDSEAFYPPDTATRSMAEQRRIYDAYAAAFALPRPAGIAVAEGALAAPGRRIGLRLYRPADAPPRGTLVYAHGGGFVLGSLDSHDGIVARLAARTGAAVVAVDYRLAPEHPAPAARLDVEAVVAALALGAGPWPDLPSTPLGLAGDSAGATLVAGAALTAAGQGLRLAALGLVYPMLAFETRGPACHTEAEAPMLSLADVRAYRDAWLARGRPAPFDFPLDAPSLAGLPPTLAIAAERDPLRDDAGDFIRRVVAEAGVAAACHVAPGLVHGFLRAIDRSPGAAAAFETLTEFLAAHLGKVGDEGAGVAPGRVLGSSAP